MDEDLRVADRIAVQFLDVEVVHRQPGVPDHQPGDRGLLARPEQENVPGPQVDGVHPPPAPVVPVRIDRYMFWLRAPAQTFAPNHPPRVVAGRFDHLSKNSKLAGTVQLEKLLPYNFRNVPDCHDTGLRLCHFETSFAYVSRVQHQRLRSPSA